jgi:hypothetical protein
MGVAGVAGVAADAGAGIPLLGRDWAAVGLAESRGGTAA